MVQQRERSGERPFTGTFLDAKSVKQGISKRALARALTLLNSPLYSYRSFREVYPRICCLKGSFTIRPTRKKMLNIVIPTLIVCLLIFTHKSVFLQQIVFAACATLTYHFEHDLVFWWYAAIFHDVLLVGQGIFTWNAISSIF